jgi:hypothetical protein
MAAAMTGDQAPMRLAILCVFLALPAVAHADPVQEARSATAACLSAVIDNAPVDDIDGDDVTIRRGKEPVSCTVRVSGGEPVVIRDAVLTSIRRRLEGFQPARSRWEPDTAASRETFCNLPGRRALNVVVVTAKPDRQPVLQATVFETPKRDERCDRDLGLQKAASAEPIQAAAASPEPAKPAEPAKEKKKKGWLSRLPGL